MSIIDTLITDRTPDGFYGASDLNRVGMAMAYLSKTFQHYGYAVTVSSRTDWTFTDRVTTAAAKQYLDDLRKLHTVLARLASTPPVPSGAIPFNAEQANDIEQILKDAHRVLESLRAVMLRAAQPMLQCGFALHLPREDFAVATAQELDVYTAEGAQVYAW